VVGHLGGVSRLGDTVAALAGGSLIADKEPQVFKVKNFLLNVHKLSTYGLDQQGFQSYFVNMVFNDESNLKSNLGEFILDFNVCEKIDVEPGKKHKFIINKLSSLLFTE
jgi:hypothetical protein